MTLITTFVTFIALLAWAWGSALWAHGAGTDSVPWAVYTQSFYLSGVLSIGLMSLAMVLAVRLTWLERPFGGIDQMYRLHKWTGIAAVGFAAMHWLLEMADDIVKALYGRAGRPAEQEYGGWLGALQDVGEEMGEWAIYVALAMLVITLWKRFPYHLWRHLHRVMPVLYLGVALHSAVLAPADYWAHPIGWLLAGLLTVGSLAAGWTLTGQVGRSRRYAATVVSVQTPTPGVTELVCRVQGAWRGHQAGQFAFLTLNWFEGAHPFTIASAPHGDGLVTFQIKALGDFTRQLGHRAQPGQPVTVEGPYGQFKLSRQRRSARQIWVAGGVGVTPFLAWLDSLAEATWQGGAAPEADLHYFTRQAADDPFARQLRTRCAAVPSVKLHVHESNIGLTPTTPEQLVAESAQAGQRTEVWFCGPAGLGQRVRAGLKRKLGWRLRFHQEAFEMR